MMNVWFKMFVIILGVISCLTLIGIIWGYPMIHYALTEEWIYID